MSGEDWFWRNKEISAAILEGETYDVVSRRYGISPERVRQILAKHVMRVAPELFAEATTESRSISTASLRSRKEFLIPKIFDLERSVYGQHTNRNPLYPVVSGLGDGADNVLPPHEK